jgi:hypothetical protein
MPQQSNGARPSRRDDPQGLHDILDTVRDRADGGEGAETRLGDVLDAFGRRSHGPLLFVPGFIALAPTGAIPGVGIACAAVVLVVAVQLMLSPERPWIPQRLRRLSLSSSRLQRGAVLAKKTMGAIDRVLSPRLTWFFDYGGGRLIAAQCVVMAALMVPFAFVPFAAAAPGLAITLFGLAVTARDGIAAAVASGVAALSLALAGYLFL